MSDDSENEARRQSEWFTSMARGLGSEVDGARLQAVLRKLHAAKASPAKPPDKIAPREGGG